MWQTWDRLEPHAFRYEDGAAKDAIFAALNRPAGLLTQALLDRLTARRPRTADDVPGEIWARLTTIAEGKDPSCMYARVLLASRLGWLYTVNAPWVDQHLLKYFDWEHSAEAPAVWQGYLWQARATPELWSKVKNDFLGALRDKERLGKYANQICTAFGFICIDQPDWLTTAEMQSALRSLDAKGRAVVARVVFWRLEGAADKGEALWSSRIAPWLGRVWPKDRMMVDADSALNFAAAVVYTGAAFESAVSIIAPFLTWSDQYSFVGERLKKTEHPERNPASVLHLLDLIVDTGCRWPDQPLREVMNRIHDAQAAFATDARFKRLDKYLRLFNR